MPSFYNRQNEIKLNATVHVSRKVIKF